MKTVKFKTNIKCDACVAKVTPHLNEVAGMQEWEVDLKDPARPLTVSLEGGAIEKVKEAVNDAGYQAELM